MVYVAQVSSPSFSFSEVLDDSRPSLLETIDGFLFLMGVSRIVTPRIPTLSL